MTAAYQRMLEAAFVLLPSVTMLYLHLSQASALVFRDHGVHEAAILASILLALFAAWVAFRCYVERGEPSLKFLTLAFVGFAVVHAPHGLLTRHADHDVWLFLLYGPASRVVMAAFLLEALMRHGDAPDPVEHRRHPGHWLPWLAGLAAVDGAVLVVAQSRLAAEFGTRLLLEGLSMGLCLAGVVVIRRRGFRSLLMAAYQGALLAFVQSSLAFLLAPAWTHLWWLAHAIFAGGFLLLSYGLVRAYNTTRSFANVCSEEEIADRLAASEAAAAAHRDAERRLRELFDGSPMGIVLAEPDGAVRHCNRRLSEMFGLDARWPPTDERAFYADPAIRDRCAARALETGAPVPAELECLRADGARLWARVTWVPLSYGGKDCVVAWTADVTDQHRAADALHAAKEAAELANRAKTEFLAAMSHELRTPLNAINGFAETMATELLGPVGNDRYKEYCGHILDSGRHLTSLINDVLDVATVETGREILCEEELSVARLVEAALTMVGDRVRKGRLRLEVDLAADLPALQGDERRVKQVLVALLANAVKFTPAGGSVMVRGWRQGDGGVAVAVRDTGIGIHPDDHPKALAPFQQVDSGLSRRHGGMGLGLSLAQRLMAMHDGALELDSTPGCGTTVTLRFPPARSRPAAA